MTSNLKALLLAHQKEEKSEAQSFQNIPQKSMHCSLPVDGVVTDSSRFLQRLYQGERMPREKKPIVFSHAKSKGAWMSSIDDPPFTVLDGMSQTATLCAGFEADRVVRAYVDGRFDQAALINPDTNDTNEAIEDFKQLLLRQLPHYKTVSFSNSGAEANEKALGLCFVNRKNDKQRHVLAFEGGFHGRTLLALHATHNPKKRGPYEVLGYEASFAPFPECSPEKASSIVAEPNFTAALLDEGAASLLEKHKADTLLASELESLAQVQKALESGKFFACIVEAMQSEGGERYASARFFQALRLLTRLYDLPLIVDEVQTGFGLGRRFFWHQELQLIDRNAKPDYPDLLCFSKRAQLGITLSNYEDRETSSVHLASLLRGQLHAMEMLNDESSAELERQVEKELEQLSTTFADLMLRPRVHGNAIAFDLPSEEHLHNYLKQRFWRGVVVFAAGSRTVRCRLNKSFGPRELAFLFASMRFSLEWLREHPHQEAPSWQNPDTALEKRQEPRYSIRQVHSSERERLLPAMLALEAEIYEPARRDSRETLGKAFSEQDGIALVAEDAQGRLAGFILAVPLETVKQVPGPATDPNLGRHNTVYVQSLTVRKHWQGCGMGRALKHKTLCIARDIKDLQGQARYLYQTGRNRVGQTAAMSHLNQRFGAYEVERLSNQYDEEQASALYYQIHLRGFGRKPQDSQNHQHRLKALSSGLSTPFLKPPPALQTLYEQGALFGPCVNKLTLCNYVTPAVVRAIEWISALCPEHPHLYLTSSRDECIDKSLRSLRSHRKEAQIAVSFKGAYLGHTTAAARSLSDPVVHHAGPSYFQHWPLIAHPNQCGIENTLESLKEVINEAGGSHKLFAVFVESIQERTGEVLQERDWSRLYDFCQQNDLPLILVETASGYYRSGQGAFYSSRWSKQPDIRSWWSGAQLGFIHLKSDYFVDTPLTMVSTWDGDELSLIRTEHQLKQAWQMDLAPKQKSLNTLCEALESHLGPIKGAGLYRVLQASPHLEKIAKALSQAGYHYQIFANGTLALALPLDVSQDQIRELKHCLAACLQEIANESA
ncbi:MAG: aminotransferase class III-fold pyridoxal phosphate-dependent enzyme [Myxococcales bacterium]|nr:MAG: aminotransferase class III-fold pyridoxal phosphate-dependent enzyme [Myxococcales bacterium]